MAVELAHVAIIVGLLSIEVMEDMLGDVIVHYGDDIIEHKLVFLYDDTQKDFFRIVSNELYNNIRKQYRFFKN